MTAKSEADKLYFFSAFIRNGTYQDECQSLLFNSISDEHMFATVDRETKEILTFPGVHDRNLIGEKTILARIGRYICNDKLVAVEYFS